MNEISGALKFIILILLSPKLSSIFIQEINPDTLIWPACSNKDTLPRMVSYETTLLYYACEILCHFNFHAFCIYMIIPVIFNMWICDDSQFLIMLFSLCNKFTYITEFILIKCKVSLFISMFNIQPEHIHWHLKLFKEIYFLY